MNGDLEKVDIEKSFKEFTAAVENIQGSYSKLLAQIRELVCAHNTPDDFLEEMAGNLAHGIRNPLGGITNFVALLSDELTPEHSWRIKRIQDGVHRIDGIVKRLISFSQPVSPRFIRCNAVDIISGVIDLARQSTAADRINFRFTCPADEIYVQVDSELVRRAVTGILDNAVEAMPDGGEIVVSLSEDETRIQLAVRDCGVGLRGADEARLFAPFYTTKVNGMGLGLTVARIAVAKHNGEIVLRENPDRGVTVGISLPIVQS